MLLAELCHGPDPPRGQVIPLFQDAPPMLDVMGPDGRVWSYGRQERRDRLVTYGFFYGVSWLPDPGPPVGQDSL